jgi:hypothetical protein
MAGRQGTRVGRQGPNGSPRGCQPDAPRRTQQTASPDGVHLAPLRLYNHPPLLAVLRHLRIEPSLRLLPANASLYPPREIHPYSSRRSVPFHHHAKQMAGLRMKLVAAAAMAAALVASAAAAEAPAPAPASDATAAVPLAAASLAATAFGYLFC